MKLVFAEWSCSVDIFVDKFASFMIIHKRFDDVGQFFELNGRIKYQEVRGYNGAKRRLSLKREGFGAIYVNKYQIWAGSGSFT